MRAGLHSSEELLDICNILHDDLGIDIFNADWHEIADGLIEIQHKPPAIKRKVIMPSTGLHGVQAGFDHDLIRKLKSVRVELMRGDDVTWRFSRGNDKLSDYLLKTWDIRHLHVTGKSERRIDKTLFCIFRYRKAYLLGMWGHEIYDDTLPMFDFLNQAFPCLMPNKTQGVEPTHELTGKEQRQLRKHGVATFITLSNGEVALPNKFGFTGGGYTPDQIKQADLIVELCRNGELKKNKNGPRDRQLASSWPTCVTPWFGRSGWKSLLS